MRPAATFLALLLCICTTDAMARGPSLVGKWRFNAKESESLPGDEPPAELIMAVTKDDATQFQWTISVKMADGGAGAIGFDGAIDGKAYPVKGRDGSTSAFTWMPDGTLKRVDQSAGGIVVETCEISAKEMSCAARQTDVKGRVATYTEIFDRM